MFQRKRRHISYNCSFCGKAQDQVQHIIAGPGCIYVCDECIIAFLEGNTGLHKDVEAADGKSYSCSFCGKKRTQVHQLIAGSNGVNICDQCIDLCCEIIESERQR